MSVASTNQHDQVLETKNDTSIEVHVKDKIEKWRRFKELLKNDGISKTYVEGGVGMYLGNRKFEDADWNAISDEISTMEPPLRELYWVRYPEKGDSGLIKPEYVKFLNIISTLPTLEKLSMKFDSITNDNITGAFLKALAGNRSIKDLDVESDTFNFETARAFTNILMNNQTLISLRLSISAAPAIDENHYDATFPVADECIVELGHSLQTTVIERLTIHELDNSGLGLLIPSLPKTLVFLDLTGNKVDGYIPTLYSYLHSNGHTLKQLFLDGKVDTSYLQKEALLLGVQILTWGYWKEKNFCSYVGTVSLSVEGIDSDDQLKLIRDQTKDDTTLRNLSLTLSEQFNQNHLNYVQTMLNNQSHLRSLTITNDSLNASIQIQLFRQLKQNKSIVQLQIHFEIDSTSLSELANLLANNDHLTFLDLTSSLNLTDEGIIILTDGFKTNTVLQSLTIQPESQIGDNGFQFLLSSLPNSLFRFLFSKSLITATSLPSILTLVKTHPHLREVSIGEKGKLINSTPQINVPDFVEKILEITDANHCICKIYVDSMLTEKIFESRDGVIHLGNLDVQDDDILELFDALKKNSNRNWSFQSIANKKMSNVGYRYVKDILSSTISIVELEAYPWYITHEAQLILLAGISNNKTLKSLILLGWSLNNQSLEYIATFIQNNPELKQIRFQSGIDTHCLVHLTKVLLSSKLETLYLHSNSLDDSDCALLLSSIPPSLKTLSLHDNEITDSSFQTIINFLLTNRTLTNLDLGKNPIVEKESSEKSDAVKEQLREAMQQNGICNLD